MLAEWSLVITCQISIEIVIAQQTDDLVELLPVVEDQCINLGIGGFLRDALILILDFRKVSILVGPGPPTC